MGIGLLAKCLDPDGRIVGLACRMGGNPPGNPVQSDLHKHACMRQCERACAYFDIGYIVGNIRLEEERDRNAIRMCSMGNGALENVRHWHLVVDGHKTRTEQWLLSG